MDFWQNKNNNINKMHYKYANPMVKKFHEEQLAIDKAIEDAVRIRDAEKEEANKHLDRQAKMLAASEKYIKQMELIHKKQQ